MAAAPALNPDVSARQTQLFAVGSDGKLYGVRLDESTGALLSSTTATFVAGDIEIGAVELKNGTDDTRAIVTAANALKVDGSAVTQPVSIATAPVLVAGAAIIGKVGIDQSTPGTTNLVALSAETTKVIGTVNQGTSPWVISGTVTANAGTGTLAVSIASVPSHAVTNAGTFATQSAITAASGAMAAGSQVDLLTMRGTLAAGTAATNSLLTGGVYNSTTPVLTNAQQLATQMDTSGAIRISSEGGKATYSASSTISLAAGATDVLTITGSSSKTIRVTRISIAGIATTASAFTIFATKRSTANTGGTSAAQTATPHDANNAAASATVLSYTANPTTGTLVGNLRDQYLFYGVSSAPAIAPSPIVWDFSTRNQQAVVLRGTAQVLAVNLAGQTITGGVLSIDIEWTEE